MKFQAPKSSNVRATSATPIDKVLALTNNPRSKHSCDTVRRHTWE
ncbi:BgTH12-05212 [Blumeria graminis f. sp. triticale]|uniref:BgTH12-05212 n=1 Tax=Blumeria graminis f. sp. triticale TaxID=1689686 RepID=A0A9W4D1X4_BLUGR|nr:BgTH12-05212 [Blumeria graminis f. sp. triticale]